MTFVCMIDRLSDPVCVLAGYKRDVVLLTHLFLSVHFPVRVLGWEEAKICEYVQTHTDAHTLNPPPSVLSMHIHMHTQTDTNTPTHTNTRKPV